MNKTNAKNITRLLLALSLAFLLSACSSGGDSGGSDSGTGSSTVEGKITSVQLAMNQAVESHYTQADFFNALTPFPPMIRSTPW